MTRGPKTLACFSFAMLLAGSATAQSPCVSSTGTSRARFFIEPVRRAARDTVVVARLCLSAGPKPIGSYMATLTYDSTRMRVARVDVTGGMQATNAKTAGIIRIAGASPNGFQSGLLAAITFRPVGSRMLGSISLSLGEVSSPGGASMLGEARATGWTAGAAPAAITRPVVDSISPREAEVDRERVTDLVLYGRGFASSENVVLFDGAEVRGLLSESGGTIIRFAAPTFIPASGGVAAHRVDAGTVQVRVRHAGLTSNAVRFTVKEDR